MHKYHIIIYNIKLYKKWLTVIQTKREKKESQKEKEIDWNLSKDTKINKKEEIEKNTKIHEKFKSGISQE